MPTSNPSADIAHLEGNAPTWFNEAFKVDRTEDYAELDGVSLHYFRWGNPANPGAVLTHGFMAHARCWAFIAPLLAKDYCLVAFDLSGMGDSGTRPVYEVASRAAECRAVAEHAGLQPHPALVCHSYGGSVGLMAVSDDPDFWGKLIVCDMAMLAPDEPPRFERQRKQELRSEVRPHKVQPTYDAIRSRFRLAPDQPCKNEYLMDYMAFHSTKPVEGGYIWKFDPNIMNRQDDRSEDWWQQIAPNFAALDIPRGIIYGEHSEMMSPKVIKYLKEQTQGGVPIVEIKDAYHHVMLDQPLDLAKAIEDLLETL